MRLESKLVMVSALLLFLTSACTAQKKASKKMEKQTQEQAVKRQIAPDFELLDQNGTKHKLSSYRGKKVLVYFYPMDDTPGCTVEACTLRDSYDELLALNLQIFGVSPDSVESHKKFATKHKLPFTLLSDPKKEVIQIYGANGGMWTKRISYLIDEEGYILKAYPNVDPSNHAGQIYNDIKATI